MQSKAATVEEYLSSLPGERAEAIGRVRQVILDNLDPGFQEGMQYGMIGYCVPHSRFPAGYHCDPKQPLPYASLASQKNHMALYMMSLYGAGVGDVAEGGNALLRWFNEAWATSGKKLDMGKSCIRFKRVDDLALDVIGEAFRRVTAEAYVANYMALLEEVNPKAAAKAKKANAAAG